MTRHEFLQAKEFIFRDVEREIQLAKADAAALQALAITPGGGNFLAALGLLCYTEFGGKLRFGVKRPDGSDVASANFNQFFDLLGPAYRAFRAQHSVYDLFKMRPCPRVLRQEELHHRHAGGNARCRPKNRCGGPLLGRRRKLLPRSQEGLR